jgi:hypothetical protein
LIPNEEFEDKIMLIKAVKEVADQAPDITA